VTHCRPNYPETLPSAKVALPANTSFGGPNQSTWTLPVPHTSFWERFAHTETTVPMRPRPVACQRGSPGREERSGERAPEDEEERPGLSEPGTPVTPTSRAAPVATLTHKLLCRGEHWGRNESA
jgi:hypothetical protein